MQIQKVQNNTYNQTFMAKLVDSSSLRKFKSALNKADKEVFDSYVSAIEGSKDRKNYIFDYMQVGKFSNIKKLVTVSVQNSDKTIQHPPVFTDKPENTMDLFRKLAEQCSKKK